MKKNIRIFSGIQPTGKLHIGNYLGAIRNWVNLQNSKEKTENIYCIVDLHALTDKFNHDHDIQFDSSLKLDTLNMAAYLLASGINYEKSTLFVQSQIPEHSELCWLLNCIAPMNWLNKMTQFKDKKNKTSSLGLFSYPVLMASDILLYRANKVPVGLDQKQHIELTRDYAERFNQLFSNKGNYFELPEYVEAKVSKVMSLKDGNLKMSKSERNDNTRINIDDEPELIFDKIRKAKTDSLMTIKYEINRPEMANLIRIYSDFKEISISDTEKKFFNKNIKDFKEELAETIVERIYPIKLKAEKLLEDKDELNRILTIGKEKASKIAKENLLEIKKLMNFYN